MKRSGRLWLSSALLGGAAVVMALLLALVEVPDWQRPVWLVPAALVFPILYRVLVFMVRSRVHGTRTRTVSASTLTLSPRMWLVMVSTLIYLVALIYLVLAAQPVFAAAALGETPDYSTAVAACSTCTSHVVFLDRQGRTDSADLAGGGSISPGKPLRVVYDRAHPDRAMALSDYRAGRGGSAVWAIVAASALATGWTVALDLLGHRRRRKFGSLRPQMPIGDAGRKSRSGRQIWRITFSDGAHADYLDNEVLRTAMQGRVPGSVLRPPVEVTADSPGHRGG